MSLQHIQMNLYVIIFFLEWFNKEMLQCNTPVAQTVHGNRKANEFDS